LPDGDKLKITKVVIPARFEFGNACGWDLWDLEHYLTERRKEIDRKYDYRYSQLTLAFGKLLRESRLGEEELRGLREVKLNRSVLTPDSWPRWTQRELGF
jgi:hypothetical protein